MLPMLAHCRTSQAKLAAHAGSGRRMPHARSLHQVARRVHRDARSRVDHRATCAMAARQCFRSAAAGDRDDEAPAEAALGRLRSVWRRIETALAAYNDDRGSLWPSVSAAGRPPESETGSTTRPRRYRRPWRRDLRAALRAFSFRASTD